MSRPDSGGGVSEVTHHALSEIGAAVGEQLGVPPAAPRGSDPIMDSFRGVVGDLGDTASATSGV